ncbi:MAG: hypothetical protein ACI8WB_005519 [Phenylobacterium sp.]|jgi:hypothetical protein
MLQAILQGKAGRIEHDGEASVSWRHLFKTREDLMTAAVFSRFSYLSPEVQKHLLCQWFGFDTVQPKHDFAEFDTIEFWPRFQLSRRGEHCEVEPDIVLRFKRFNLIIEVKPPEGGNQYFTQWDKEIEALIQSEEDTEQPLYFLAIGRIESSDANKWATELKKNQGTQLVKVAAIKWQPVTDSIVKLHRDEFEWVTGQDRRILTDMIAALHLYGLKTMAFEWSPLLEKYPFKPISLEHIKLNKPEDGFLSTTAHHHLTAQLKNNPFAPLDLNVINHWPKTTYE